jgi:alkaline phosphatase D
VNPYTPLLPRFLLAHATAAALALTLALPAQQPLPESSGDPSLVLTRIAFGSCAKESEPQPLWERVLAEDPQLWIWAGDNIYGDTEDMDVMREKYARLQAIEGYARLAASVPMLATWDDHDYGVNDGGRDYPMRSASQQVFLDAFGVPADSPRRQREGIYHAATFGPEGRRVQVILLDTRYHRSPLDRFRSASGRGGAYRPLRDRDATMLGDAQWQWLEERLREPADLRLIVSSIQFVADEHRYEKWQNLPYERQRMLRTIERSGAEGVVFLSGDRHHAELSRLERADDYPLLDLTASGINQSRAPRPGTPWREPEPNTHRLGRIVRGPHFGRIDIDWDQPDPVVTLSIETIDGSLPIEHTVRLGELRRGRPVADVRDGAARDEREASIVVDGQPDEWPIQSARLVVVGDKLYARFGTDAICSLNQADESLRLGFDLDGDARTGGRLTGSESAGLEVAIEFSPDVEGRAARRYQWQPRVTVYAREGAAREVDPGDLALQVQPGYASDRFELRFDLDSEALGRDGAPRGTAVLHVDVLDKKTDRARARSTERAASSASEVQPGSPAAEIPAAPSDGIRIASWNVLWGEPQKNPQPYARVLRALRPDVLLLQEWDTTRFSEDELVAWFREHVDADREWHAMVTGTGDYGQGTAVVSWHPMPAKLPPEIPVEDTRWDFPVRCAGALIETPAGRVLAASVHLKASGSFGTDEDRRRLAEARAVNHVLQGMNAALEPEVVVVGGDFNLNGSTEVLRTAIRRLDHDRSGLRVAQPLQLGDPSLVYTFGRSPAKSRLDYLAWSETSADLVQAFVLDTTILDDGVLGAAGLERGDVHASDHLPVVLDLRPLTPRRE